MAGLKRTNPEKMIKGKVQFLRRTSLYFVISEKRDGVVRRIAWAFACDPACEIDVLDLGQPAAWSQYQPYEIFEMLREEKEYTLQRIADDIGWSVKTLIRFGDSNYPRRHHRNFLDAMYLYMMRERPQKFAGLEREHLNRHERHISIP
jgi:hypothetical protein